MKPVFGTVAIAAILAAAAMPALAQSKGDFTIGVGAGLVVPDSDNGTIDIGSGDLFLDVDDNTQLTLTFEYFLWDNIGLEVLAATPFTHDIDIADGTADAEVTHLPPTVSLNYHIPTGTALTPFVGVGVNYTTFWDESVSLDADLELEDSWGLAAQVGFDYAVSEKGAIRANIRYIDIDSDVKVNGDKVGTANIDPYVYGISYIFKF